MVTTRGLNVMGTTVPGNKGKQYPPEILTTDEVAAIIGLCGTRSPTGARNRALLLLLYRSGLRISEALSIRPSDLNVKEHSIRVLDGKGHKATTRGFHPSAEDALARWGDMRKRYGFKPGTPLFCTLDGGPVSPQYVRNLLHRLGARAGIEKRIHPHGLRHTYAVELEARRPVGQPDFQAPGPFVHCGHGQVPGSPVSNADAIAALEAVELPELGL